MPTITVNSHTSGYTNYSIQLDYTSSGNGSVTINWIKGYKTSGSQVWDGTGTTKTFHIGGNSYSMGYMSIVGYNTSGMQWKRDNNDSTDANLGYTLSCVGSNTFLLYISGANQYQINAAQFYVTMDGGNPITTPSINTPSITNITTTTANASFTVANNGGAAIVDNYIDLSLSNFGNVIKTISSSSGQFTGLTPATKYYVRANASNGSYRGYSSVTNFTTNEEPPKNLSITNLDSKWADVQRKVCITGTLNATHGAGSTGNINYKLYYKRSLDSNYSVTNLGNTTAESINFTLTTLQEDMTYNMYFTATTAGGTTTSSTISYKTIATKFVYVSENGGAFTQRKMYYNQSNGAWYLAYNKNINIIHGA